jgi:hypothetical protein
MSLEFFVNSSNFYVTTKEDYINYLTVVKNLINNNIIKKNEYFIPLKQRLFLSIFNNSFKLKNKFYTENNTELESHLSSYHSAVFRILTRIIRNRNYNEIITFISIDKLIDSSLNKEFVESSKEFEDAIMTILEEFTENKLFNLIDEINPRRQTLINYIEYLINIKIQKLLVENLLRINNLNMKKISSSNLSNKESNNEIFSDFKRSLNFAFKLLNKGKINEQTKDILNIAVSNFNPIIQL